MPRTLSPLANALLIGSIAFACSDDSGSEGGLSFATDIHPILTEKCGECHADGTGPDYPDHGDADADTAYAAITGDGVQGQKVYERILVRTDADNPVDIMPPSYATVPCGGSLGAPGCLTVAEHDLIEAWVEAGTLP